MALTFNRGQRYVGEIVENNPQLTDDSAACMVFFEAIYMSCTAYYAKNTLRALLNHQDDIECMNQTLLSAFSVSEEPAKSLAFKSRLPWLDLRNLNGYTITSQSS